MNFSHKKILIVGTGRSGTTLLAKIFDSSPAVLYRHEPDRMHVEKNLPFLLEGGEFTEHINLANDYFFRLAKQHDIRTSCSRPQFPKSFRTNFANATFKYISSTAKILERIGFRLEIPDLINGQECPTYVLKSVDSLCRAPLFLAAVPDLLVIHIVRDPRAVIASRLRGIQKRLMSDQLFTDTLIASGIADKYLADLPMITSASWVEQAAFEWMVLNDHVYSQLANHSRYKLVHYEKLCTSLVAQTKKIFAYAKIPWAQQTEAFLARLSARELPSPRYFGLDRNLHSGLANWQYELTPDFIKAIDLVISHSSVGRMYSSIAISRQPMA